MIFLNRSIRLSLNLSSLSLCESVTYTVPNSPEVIMADFYMLGYLASIDQQALVKAGRTAMLRFDDFADDIRHAESVMLPFLKTHMLESVFFAMCAEIRHYIRRRQEKPTEFMLRYSKLYNHFTSSFGQDDPRKPRDDHKFKDSNRGYQDSYAAITKTMQKYGYRPEQVVVEMRDAFLNGDWQSSYGGKPWANIADGWLRLFNARTTADQFVAIDHIYDLQHNTDTVFNKLRSYYNGGYSWIRKMLDFKANIKDMNELIPKVSSQMKKMARPVLALINRENPLKPIPSGGNGKDQTSNPSLVKGVEVKKLDDDGWYLKKGGLFYNKNGVFDDKIIAVPNLNLMVFDTKEDAETAASNHESNEGTKPSSTGVPSIEEVTKVVEENWPKDPLPSTIPVLAAQILNYFVSGEAQKWGAIGLATFLTQNYHEMPEEKAALIAEKVGEAAVMALMTKPKTETIPKIIKDNKQATRLYKNLFKSWTNDIDHGAFETEDDFHQSFELKSKNYRHSFLQYGLNHLEVTKVLDELLAAITNSHSASKAFDDHDAPEETTGDEDSKKMPRSITKLPSNLRQAVWRIFKKIGLEWEQAIDDGEFSGDEDRFYDIFYQHRDAKTMETKLRDLGLSDQQALSVVKDLFEILSEMVEDSGGY